jgi:hypothetical protein
VLDSISLDFEIDGEIPAAGRLGLLVILDRSGS